MFHNNGPWRPRSSRRWRTTKTTSSSRPEQTSSMSTPPFREPPWPSWPGPWKSWCRRYTTFFFLGAEKIGRSNPIKLFMVVIYKISKPERLSLASLSSLVYRSWASPGAYPIVEHLKVLNSIRLHLTRKH
jgi:hypothetical protein